MLGLCGRVPGPGRAAPMRPALRSFVRVTPSRASPSELTASQGLIWASRGRSALPSYGALVPWRLVRAQRVVLSASSGPVGP